MANHDRLHRNRMGARACPDLRDFLDENKILSMINIADNGIGNEGLKIISPALTTECSLVSINLSNNDLTGQGPINSLRAILRTSKCL